jgi:cytochrome c oxidase cbb3-type subunit 3
MTDKNEKKADVLRQHVYDEIQEYDNQLPRWWLFTFYITVIFGLGYWLYFQIWHLGPDSKTELAQDLATYQKASGTQNQADWTTLLTDARAQKEGQDIYVKNCAVCHGAAAQGVIGPNLTDKAWIHGGNPADIYAVIENGVAAKGMVAWKGVLSPRQIQSVVSYILSLQGTNPAGAKAAEGTLIP